MSLRRLVRLMRDDLLSAQPDRLFDAKMAEYRAPGLRSFLINEPALIDEVLLARPEAFPKSARMAAGLRPLLGRSVFLTGGAEWAAQRRVIDPAFRAAAGLAAIPATDAAARAMVAGLSPGACDVEPVTARYAADVIFRVLFSVPVDDATARGIYAAFRSWQRRQPVMSLAPFVGLPALRGRREARKIRALIARLVSDRAAAVRDGRAPDDLATGLMTTPDPATGRTLSAADVGDQVAIFYLAGHETSAAALAWSLWLLAADAPTQARAAAEALALPDRPGPRDVARLGVLRDVVRETLRLYPPVPMVVRQAKCAGTFRGRRVPKGAQVVVSPWHLGRHRAHWAEPDAFCPARWRDPATAAARGAAWLPFLKGPRACPGAGFAMTEAVIGLARVLARYRLGVEGEPPVPAAHVTLRSRDGVRVRFEAR